MTLAVDNPILNNPFEEPAHHWQYVDGQPTLEKRPETPDLKSLEVNGRFSRGAALRHRITTIQDLCKTII